MRIVVAEFTQRGGQVDKVVAVGTAGAVRVGDVPGAIFRLRAGKGRVIGGGDIHQSFVADRR